MRPFTLDWWEKWILNDGLPALWEKGGLHSGEPPTMGHCCPATAAQVCQPEKEGEVQIFNVNYMNVPTSYPSHMNMIQTQGHLLFQLKNKDCNIYHNLIKRRSSSEWEICSIDFNQLHSAYLWLQTVPAFYQVVILLEYFFIVKSCKVKHAFFQVSSYTMAWLTFKLLFNLITQKGTIIVLSVQVQDRTMPNRGPGRGRNKTPCIPLGEESQWWLPSSGDKLFPLPMPIS